MQLFLRVSQYYILRGNVPFPRAGHIYIHLFLFFNDDDASTVMMMVMMIRAGDYGWGLWLGIMAGLVWCSVDTKVKGYVSVVVS